jgi:hypothetical protein
MQNVGATGDGDSRGPWRRTMLWRATVPLLPPADKELWGLIRMATEPQTIAVAVASTEQDGRSRPWSGCRLSRPAAPPGTGEHVNARRASGQRLATAPRGSKAGPAGVGHRRVPIRGWGRKPAWPRVRWH